MQDKIGKRTKEYFRRPAARQEKTTAVAGAVGPDLSVSRNFAVIQGSPMMAVQRQRLAYTSESVTQQQTNKTGLSDEVKERMESSIGADFSDVRIHSSSSQAPDVGALAFTQGNDIHFAPGQFSPETSGGQRLLGHELAHVVQQREGRVQPTTEIAGMSVNDNPALEKEADDIGTKF